ncbi:MAG: hypothetical protein ACPF9D_13830 [Owenweeksia sp.]
MEELEEHRTKLRESLKIPEGYFTESKALAMARAAENKAPEPLMVIWRKAAVWLSAAAVITLGLFIYFNEPAPNPDVFSLNDLPDGTIEDYLMEDYAYGLEEPLIAQALAFSEPADDTWLENVSDEEIEEFLNNSRLDESILYTDYED